MDTDIIILLILLIAAFLWWFKLAYDENKSKIRDLEQQEKDRLLREERVRQLFNKH